jgi:hypothetical protein
VAINRNLESPDAAADHPALEGQHAESRHKWPLPVRLLVAAALLPLWAAVILAAEDDFSFIGTWFDPLMIALMIATVIVAWTATARSQR